MSRLDKLKEQHPELNITLIDLIGMIDPTDTYKYSEFLIKILKNWYVNTDIRYGIGIDLFGEEQVESLNEFERHCKAKRVEKNDISQHTDFRSLKVEVEKAKEILRLKELEKQTKKLFDNDEWLVIIPLSYEASKLYGMETKWCTTQERYWNDYIRKYKLIYVINKITNNKYAISRDKTEDKDLKAWLSDDTETSPLLLPIPQDLWSVIMPELQKQESVTDLIGGDLTGIINLTSGSSDSIVDRVRRLMDIIDRPVSEPYRTQTTHYPNNLSNYVDYDSYIRQLRVEDNDY
jgi:hypothetical protein